MRSNAGSDAAVVYVVAVIGKGTGDEGVEPRVLTGIELGLRNKVMIV